MNPYVLDHRICVADMTVEVMRLTVMINLQVVIVSLVRVYVY